MENYIKGTSISLIEDWLRELESAIEEDNLYCVEGPNETKYVTQLNKARLLILYDIFHIAHNDNEDAKGKYLCAHNILIKDDQGKVLAYIKTMRQLLGIVRTKYDSDAAVAVVKEMEEEKD